MSYQCKFQGIFIFSTLILIVFFSSCKKNKNTESGKLFQKKEASYSGVDFNNKLIETENLNYFNFQVLRCPSAFAGWVCDISVRTVEQIVN